MNKIKVAQIGLGHDHATVVFDSILSMPGLFEVAGFAVPECEEECFADRINIYKTEKNIKKLNLDEVLNYPGLDAIIVETEEKNLTKYAHIAAKHNLHIHMDKPGGCNLEEYTELIDVLKHNKLVFSTGYMYRFNSYIMEAVNKAKSGEIGTVYSVEAHMNCEHPKEKRQWLSQFDGGMMFYLGCHLIDLIFQIQGMPDEIIRCNASTGFLDVSADDFGMVVFRYPNGYSFAKTCAAEPGGFMRRQLVICGTKGTIEINPLEAYVYGDNIGRNNMYTEMREVKSGYVNGSSEEFISNWDDVGSLKRTELFNRYDDMMRNFAMMVCGEKDNEYSYDYELNLYKLLLKSCS